MPNTLDARTLESTRTSKSPAAVPAGTRTGTASRPLCCGVTSAKWGISRVPVDLKRLKVIPLLPRRTRPGLKSSMYGCAAEGAGYSVRPKSSGLRKRTPSGELDGPSKVKT